MNPHFQVNNPKEVNIMGVKGRNKIVLESDVDE
jgi:hypothetical protein